GARPVEMKLYVHAFKFLLQHAGNQAVRPLVEVANHQPWMLEPGREQHITAHEQVRLFTTLQVSRPQVDVEDVHSLPWSHLKIAANAAAWLAPRCCQIVNLNIFHWKTAEQHVAVHGAAPLARLPDAILTAGGVSQVLGLVLLPATFAQADDFLE